MCFDDRLRSAGADAAEARSAPQPGLTPAAQRRSTDSSGGFAVLAMRVRADPRPNCAQRLGHLVRPARAYAAWDHPGQRKPRVKAEHLVAPGAEFFRSADRLLRLLTVRRAFLEHVGGMTLTDAPEDCKILKIERPPEYGEARLSRSAANNGATAFRLGPLRRSPLDAACLWRG